MEYVLTTNCLTKQYKHQRAVDNVSMRVRKGDIYGFVGRNGAGKTTFLKMVSGLASPTSGEISLFDNSPAALARVGTLIEAPGFYPNMTAYDNLKLKCICVGINKKGYVEDKLRVVGLADAGKKKVKNFSLGMKQRLGIAMALVGEPDLLLLDEPINGLDPQGIVEVRETLIRLNREHDITIIISSHILEELSKIATNYGFIHQGKLVQEVTREELHRNCGERIVISLEQPQRACPVLEEMGISNYKVIDSMTINVFDHLDKSADITLALSQKGIRLQSIGVSNQNLESYFLDITGGAQL